MRQKLLRGTKTSFVKCFMHAGDGKSGINLLLLASQTNITNILLLGNVE